MVLDGKDQSKRGGVLETARGHVAAGISLVPVRRDGTKAAAVPWKEYQSRLPTDGELRRWFDRPAPYGIALVGGAVSGGLEQLDFDREAAEIFPAWRELVDAEQPGLSDSLHVVETPNGGDHVRYRVPGFKVPGNTKLAVDPDAPPDDRVLIETRGEGGYALAPGSPPECHESGRPYRHIAGPQAIPEITEGQRAVLVRCARSFGREVKGFPRQTGPDLRPGDDYDRRGPDWSEVLTPHGWALAGGTPAGERRWRRPGKATGWSATTGCCKGKDGSDLFRVFSGNAHPFEDGRAYGKFRAFALLNHGGDLSAAADALARRGYGNRKPSAEATAQPQTPPRGRQADGRAAVDESSALETTPLSTLRPRPIRWLARFRIPLGKVVLFAGDGGHGKSTLTLHLAACLSRGLPAFGMPAEDCLTGDTLLIQCEDDWADTVIPRLLAMGADMTRIHRQEGIRGKDGKRIPFCLAHCQALERTLEARPEIKLVTIDPAGAYIGGVVDDHKDSELRSLLGPLAELAARRGVTIVLVKHFSKAPTAKAVSKISGSTGYVNTVRTGFVVLPDGQDQDRALFLPVKFNIGRRPKGLTYRRESVSPEELDELLKPFEELSADDRRRIGEAIFHIRWEGETDATADALLADAMRSERGPKKAKRCAAWMKQFLAEYAYPSDEILAAAKAEGFTFDNVKEAKASLKSDGLRSTSKGSFQGVWWCGFGDPWQWVRRPETSAPHIGGTPHIGGNQQEMADPPSIVGRIGPKVGGSDESPHFGTGNGEKPLDSANVGSPANVGSGPLYETNELNEKSPPGGGDWTAPGLTTEETRTPFDRESEGEG
jgi:hypothetical protein